MMDEDEVNTGEERMRERWYEFSLHDVLYIVHKEWQEEIGVIFVT